MSDVMRWRYGDTNPVMLAVAAETVVEIGDLLYLVEGQVQPASAAPTQGSESGDQQWFHDRFAGVAMQKSRAGDERPIRVATTGVFDFEMASQVVEVGDLIGAVHDVTAVRLENQKVKPVDTAAHAIGRCAKREPIAATRVLVDIVATVAHGGPQNPAS